MQDFIRIPLQYFLNSPAHLAAGITAIFAFAGIAYNLICIVAALSFSRWSRGTAKATPSFLPPISILKPLRGVDPGIEEALRSHCLQNYPEYEVIFGVSDPEDPVVPLAAKLQRQYPDQRIRLVVCPEVLGTNRKISTLAQLVPHAHHPYLLVNDSDIRVHNDYLRCVVTPFMDSDVGLVTCLYRANAGQTVGSKLEALGISTDFALGVMVARLIQGVRFGLGSTLLFSRKAYDDAGGFAAIHDYLADDYELGSRIAEAGFEVVLSDTIVDHNLPNYSFQEFFQHQIRWARTIRDARPSGYFGLVFTFSLPWAFLTLLLAWGAKWSWLLVGIAAMVRFIAALAGGSFVLKDPQVRKNFLLIPFRDLFAPIIWILSFMGREVKWRGETFILEKGKLRPASTA